MHYLVDLLYESYRANKTLGYPPPLRPNFYSELQECLGLSQRWKPPMTRDDVEKGLEMLIKSLENNHADYRNGPRYIASKGVGLDRRR